MVLSLAGEEAEVAGGEVWYYHQGHGGIRGRTTEKLFSQVLFVMFVHLTGELFN
jgi:hypothetical protein